MRKVTSDPTEEYPVQVIRLCDIQIEDQKMRYDLDDDGVIAMANSIQRDGLLQTPGVSPREGGGYTLIWGGRRYAAHLRLGKEAMLCRVRPTPPSQIKAIALVENLHRKQMTLEEECAAVHFLHVEQDISIAEISDQLSHSRDWILKRLAVPTFPQEIREPLLEGLINLGTAEAISALPEEGVRRYTLSQVLQSRMSISETKALVKALQQTPNQHFAVEAGVEAAFAPTQQVTVYVDCQACGYPRLPQDLVTVRVCAHGCNTPQETTNQHPDTK